MLKIPDIIQLNDWDSKKFLRIMVAIQLAMLGAIGLDVMGLEIPILRQVVGFIYLTFVPGIIILRLLKLHKLGASETILLSTGISISFLMFSGFFLNSMSSFLKVKSPLSFWNVVIFITVLVAILCMISYKRDRFYLNESQPLKISRSALYLMLLPVLSIVGTYFVNFHKNNIVLLIMIVLIALIPILIALKKIQPELYPLAITVISISLLFHMSLISMYLIGWDIHAEYYIHKLVVDNEFWDSTIYSNLNAMLSIAILPAVYSYFLKMDGAWVFKIAYQIIFSLVPLGLYCIYQRQIKSDKIAFYSVLFFMSFFSFFLEMISLARQEIAEFFFVLLIFLMVQETMSKIIRNFLILVFCMSLVTSHYGLSYIFIILIVFINLFYTDFFKTSKIKGLILPDFNLKKITFNYFVTFFIIFALVWYFFVSSASVIESIVYIVDHVITSIFTEFFNPENRDNYVLMALGIRDPAVPSFGREVHRDLQLMTQLFIIMGFYKIIISREYAKFKAEYFYLIMASFFILLLSLLPFSAKALNMTRIYQITLFALSPLFVIGGAFIIQNSIKITMIKNKLRQNHVILILILGVLVPYFLFNTGFVYEITKDVPTSIPLGMERMKNDTVKIVDLYNTYTTEQDVVSARWYYEYKYATKKIYADWDSKLHVLNSYGMTPQYMVNSLFKNDTLLNQDELSLNYYLYLRKFNVCDNTFETVNTTEILSLTDKSSRIYSNGCGDIYER
jgi:uncharacterized membrane protein